MRGRRIYHDKSGMREGKNMGETLEQLQQRLQDLEAQIEDQHARLPAHSVRPAMIQELEELEERRDALRAEIERFKSGNGDG
jgi:cell division protein FtsB